MPFVLPRRRALLLAAPLAIALALALAVALGPDTPTALASHDEISIVQEDLGLMNKPIATLQRLRALGVQQIRFPARWYTVAPFPGSYRKPRFNDGDPGARLYNFDTLDMVVRDATQFGISVDLDVVGGAPYWALGKGSPIKGFNTWEPSATDLGQFVKALGLRYSGTYDPLLRRQVKGDPHALPRVSFWSVWNEPDYGPSLAPQGLPGHLNIEYSPNQYRKLLGQAWNGLQHSGHKGDTILFGELAPRGLSSWGVFSGMKPLVFLRALYCVDSHYRPLRGSAASLRGCPRTAGGSRRFAANNPALFDASGIADHPYMRWYAPNHEPNPDPYFRNSTADYTSLGDIGQLERSIDRLQRVYGSHRRLPIYDTEFGYITSPPKHHDYPYVSPTTAAYYLNWAEYIHWRDPRIMSYDQYLLQDPLPALKSNSYGGFASGLITYSGKLKPTYSAYRLPLYLPVTSARRGSKLEVWGCIRPARTALQEGLSPQTAKLQVGHGANPPDSAFQTVATVTITDPNNCYFDQRVSFPGSGTETVRLVYRYPTSDPYSYFDPLVATGTAVYSRHVQITLK